MSQFLLSLICGISIGIIAGYLGSLMLTKRMALIGGPLGHLALPGIALALFYQFNIFLGALLSIGIGAIFIWYLKVKTEISMEALVGLVFASGVALSFLILPIDKAEAALVGDISLITFFDLLLTIIITATLFLLVKKIYSKMILIEISEDLAQVEGVNVKKYNLLYLIAIALIVALEVKLVGGLMTVAMFIIPAASAQNISRNLKQYTRASTIVGSLSAFLGIIISRFTSFSAGPLIITVATLFFILTLIFKR